MMFKSSLFKVIKINIISVFFIIFVIEIVLSGVRYFKNKYIYIDYRVNADTYNQLDKEWLQKYFIEFTKCGVTTWIPFTYWRRKPFVGDYINIDKNNLRKTSDSNFNVEYPKLFMLGGSTMWGTGARDEYTIPSIISKGLKVNGIDMTVINYGESGYFSSQELILLLKELQKGNIPDYVIFYDGVNDVFTSYQQGVAGLTQNEFKRMFEYNPSRFRSILIFLDRSATYSLIKKIKRKVKSKVELNQSKKQYYISNDSEKLTNDVVKIYKSNIKTLQALSEEYSFKILFYWQPTIFDKTTLTKYESDELLKQNQLKKFHNKVRKLVNEDNTLNQYTNFYNISDIFMNYEKPVFIDYCHLGENGNKVIASRMLKDLIPLIKHN